MTGKICKRWKSLGHYHKKWMY